MAWACADGQVTPVRDRPFTATRKIVDHRPGEEHTIFQKMARSSEGATYFEVLDDRTGGVFCIIVLNQAHGRSFTLYPEEHTYVEQTTPAQPLPASQPLAETAERELHAALAEQPHTETRQNGSTVAIAPLGVRTWNGYTVYGRRMTYSNLPASSRLRERIWEEWKIPGEVLTQDIEGFGEDHQLRTQTVLTEFSTVEPDPALFEIPTGYIPRPAAHGADRPSH